MLVRLRGDRSAAARIMASHAPGLAAARSGAAGMGREGDAGYPASWEVPYVPAAGNIHLQEGLSAADRSRLLADAEGGCIPTWSHIVSGQAATPLLANPGATHQLEAQLATLAPRLAAHAVVLRAAVLPAMPWLSVEAVDRLQAETAQVAQAAAECANSLSQLCCLLPGAPVPFGETAASKATKARAREVDAGRDSWLWSQPPPADADAAAQSAQPSPPSAQASVESIVESILSSLAPHLKDRRAGMAALKAGLSPVAGRLKLCDAEVLAARGRSALLERELQFCCRTASLQAQHVSHLMMTTAQALAECRGNKQGRTSTKAS